jgi:N-terminal EH-domain containing protein
MADWGVETSPAIHASVAAGAGGGPPDEIADRTTLITGRLKSIYRKTVLPVEKRYRYDYFYESPLLTDCEFDGET